MVQKLNNFGHKRVIIVALGWVLVAREKLQGNRLIDGSAGGKFERIPSFFEHKIVG